MAVEVATFTPRAPVSLFESQRLSLDTVFRSIIRPNLFAEVDPTGEVARLRRTTAVLTALALSNTSASSRTVDIQVLSSRRITYQALVTAQAGQNWVRIDRATRPRGVAIFGYDWSQTPPVRLSDEPTELSGIMRSLAWTSDSAYLAATQSGSRFRIYDATNDFATAYTSPAAPAPVLTMQCVWSPDDRYLAVTYQFADGIVHPFIKVFDFDSGITTPVEVALPSVSTAVTRTPAAVAWGGPSGRYLVVSSAGSARFVAWDWNSGSPVLSALGGTLSAATSGVAGPIAFNTSVGSPRIAVGHSTGARLSVFDFPTATTLAKIDLQIFAANTQRTIPIDGLAWSEDNRYLAALSAATSLTPFTVYDFNSGVALRTPPNDVPVLPAFTSLDWSSDGRYLVLGHLESTRYTYYTEPLPYLLLYDYDSGSPVRVTTSPTLQGFGTVTQVRFSPDGNTLMIAGWSYDRFYPPTGVDNVRLLDSSGNDLIRNGSFEDTTGLTPEAFGFSAVDAIPEWFVDGGPNIRVFLPNQPFVGAFATDGSVYLDVVAEDFGVPPTTNNDARLRQNISGLVTGQTYALEVDITSSFESDIGVRLIWNGTPITLDGETVLPITKSLPILSVVVPPGETLQAPLAKHMLSYGEALQIKASGSGVDAAVSYILSTQEGDGE